MRKDPQAWVRLRPYPLLALDPTEVRARPWGWATRQAVQRAR